MFLSQLRHWKISEISLVMRNWDTIEHTWEKNLKGWKKICQQKLNGKYVGQHCIRDWKSLGHSSEQHSFESVRGCKHAVLAVSLIRGRRQWWRGFYSNTVSLALRLKAFYLQLQILLDLILSCLEISPLSCTHFPACNLTSPWYLHYLSVVLHSVSRWKFSLKSDLSLCSLEFQIILPSSVGKEYHGQNT